MTADLTISLIGMPGSGKSTVGAALAKHLALELVDADGLIEAQEQQTLQQIMDGRGNAAFRAIEEQVLTDMPIFPSVISTGGSVVYSEKIMARLAAASSVGYLRATFDTLEEAKKKLHDHAEGLDADAAESVQGFFIEHDDEVVFSTFDGTSE